MTTGKTAQSNNTLRELLLKLIFVLVLAVFLVLVYVRADAKEIALSDLDEALRSSTDIESLEACTERDLMQFLGIDASAVDEFLYYKSGEALGVEEVLILKVGDKEMLSPLRDAVNERISKQLRAFEGYGPEQVKLLERAVVILKGRYLFYAVAPDTEAYEEVFRNAV